MISKSSKYALKAVTYLAKYSSERNKIMVKELTTHVDVPKPYIAKILQKLVKENIASSVKGPKGGFYLSPENLNSSVLNVIYTIDGKEKLNNCVLNIKGCDLENPCPMHHISYALKLKLLKNWEKKKIKDLVE